MEADPKVDIRESLAYPKRWQAKANPRVPYAPYPKMPLIHDRNPKTGELTGKADVPIYDKQRQPLIFESARAEADWLAKNPKEAALIAEAKSDAPPTADKLADTSRELTATKDTNKRLQSEIDAKDTQLADALAQLEAAKIELAAKRAAKAQEGSDGGKIDMRTKEGRELARLAAEAKG